jgi:hypothetical protein
MYPKIGKDKCISLDNLPDLMHRLSGQIQRVELKLTDVKVGIRNWDVDRYKFWLGYDGRATRGCVQRQGRINDYVWITFRI